MKPSIRAAAAIAAASLLFVYGCSTQGITRMRTKRAPAETRTTAVAHRGGAALAPENTLAAFAAGLATRADAVELDVHLSQDGHLVVIHDPTLIRTTGVEGAVADSTLEKLRALDASAGFDGATSSPQRIPQLSEVLELIRGKSSVQVEIKVKSDGSRYPGIEALVVETLREYGMIDSAVIISFDFPTLTEIQAIEPALETGALISRAYMQQVGAGGPSKVAAEMKSLDVDYVGVSKSYFTAPLLDELRKQGLKAGVWTVDDEKEMRDFAAMRPDFITSNRPDLLVSILRPE